MGGNWFEKDQDEMHEITEKTPECFRKRLKTVERVNMQLLERLDQAEKKNRDLEKQVKEKDLDLVLLNGKAARLKKQNEELKAINAAYANWHFNREVLQREKTIVEVTGSTPIAGVNLYFATGGEEEKETES